MNFRAAYAAAEQTARDQRRGLWRGRDTPVSPWDWRARHRGN